MKGTKQRGIRHIRAPLSAVARRGAGRSVPAALAAALLLATACSGGAAQLTAQAQHSVGPGEGALRLLGLPGFVENGSPDPRVNWVTSFERRTGCLVTYTEVTNVGLIPSMFQRGGQEGYDGVVAPPTVTSQLIAAGLIAPLNPAFVGGYPAIDPALRGQAAVTSGGRTYGIPYVWSAYVLGYLTQSVPAVPRSWAALFDPSSAARYAGRIVLPDTPLTIALAALYLKATQPSLGITDPYELTGTQLAAAAGLLKRVRPSITQYDAADPETIDALATGRAVLGAVLPRNVDVLVRAGRKAASTDPAEGTTGSVDFWLMNADAPDPNCMYQWLSWSLTPRLQQQVAEWSGMSPVNPAACDGLGRRLCALYHAADPAYLSKVEFAHQPGPDCGNGRHDCAGWAQWQRQWSSILRAPPAG